MPNLLTNKKESSSLPLHWGLFNLYRHELMGVACFWIMLHHNFIHWTFWFKPLQLLFAFGGCGVDIFLLLSGIGLYQSWSRKPSLFSFYKRRFLRLYIPYLLIGLPFWIWYDLIVKKGSFFFDLFFLSFFQGEHTFWFIPAITVFYILFPVFYSLIFRKNTHPLSRTLLFVFGIIITSVLLWKLAPQFYKNTGIAISRTGIFILGINLGAYVSRKTELPDHAPLDCLIILSIAVLLIKTVSIPPLWMRFFYIVMSISLCILLCSLFHSYSPTSVKTFFQFFGKHSLELYMLHIVLKRIWGIKPLFHLSFDPSRTIEYVCIIILACLIAYPIQKLISKCYTKLLT